MKLSTKAIGAGSVIMALGCAALPVAGGALAGGLALGGGTVGPVLGGIVLVGVGAVLARRRRRKAPSHDPAQPGLDIKST